MPRDRRMSLQTIDFNPNPFQAVEFTPQAADVSLLSTALARQEERENAANTQLAEALKSFATLRSQMSQDAKTMARFDEWRNDKMNRLYNLRNLDPDRARKEAQLLGVEVAEDAEMQGRIRNNVDKQKWLEDLEKDKSINQITKDRLKEQEELRDMPDVEIDPNTGNIIGTKKWKALESPKPNVSRLDIAAFVSKIVAPEESGRQSQSTRGRTRSDKSGYQTMSMSGKTVRVLSADRLHDVFDKAFAEFPGARDSLMQDYKDDVWRLKKIDEELATASDTDKVQLEDEKRIIRERLFTDNGAGIQRSPTEYMAWAMDCVIDNMAYEHTDIKSASVSDVTETPEDSGSNGLTGLIGLPAGFRTGSGTYFRNATVGTVMQNYGGYGYNAGQAVAGAAGWAQDYLPSTGDMYVGDDGSVRVYVKGKGWVRQN